MNRKHWYIIGTALTGIGMQLGGLPHWPDITPLFVSGILVTVGSTITALFTDKAE
jgi:hypothetical protein